jgi:hypothetical protein
MVSASAVPLRGGRLFAAGFFVRKSIALARTPRPLEAGAAAASSRPEGVLDVLMKVLSRHSSCSSLAPATRPDFPLQFDPGAAERCGGT